jgi:hypothetical protein
MTRYRFKLRHFFVEETLAQISCNFLAFLIGRKLGNHLENSMKISRCFEEDKKRLQLNCLFLCEIPWKFLEKILRKLASFVEREA